MYKEFSKNKDHAKPTKRGEQNATGFRFLWEATEQFPEGLLNFPAVAGRKETERCKDQTKNVRLYVYFMMTL